MTNVNVYLWHVLFLLCFVLYWNIFISLCEYIQPEAYAGTANSPCLGTGSRTANKNYQRKDLVAFFVPDPTPHPPSRGGRGPSRRGSAANGSQRLPGGASGASRLRGLRGVGVGGVCGGGSPRSSRLTRSPKLPRRAGKGPQRRGRAAALPLREGRGGRGRAGPCALAQPPGVAPASARWQWTDGPGPCAAAKGGSGNCDACVRKRWEMVLKYASERTNASVTYVW